MSVPSPDRGTIQEPMLILGSGNPHLRRPQKHLGAGRRDRIDRENVHGVHLRLQLGCTVLGTP